VTLVSVLDGLARLGVAFYFLWATWFNAKAWGHHIAEFKRIGVGPAPVLLSLGILAQALGAILVLIPQTAALGAFILAGFTLAADALFHRYWTYPDPNERVIHQFFLFEHMALVGGLLAIAALHL
jgi:uncharacterized membrane protein YphA (DoxX/SURF4 family)